jgi:hypothetical protein
MPTARYGQSTASYNGKIYVFGGYKDSALHVVESYDPINDVWTQKRPMPYAAFIQAAVIYDGKIYLWGNDWQAVPTMRYDPTLDTFEILPYSNGVYVFDVRSAVPHYASRKIFIAGWDTYEYYPENNILYESFRMPDVWDGSAVIINDKIYVLKCTSGVNDCMDYNVITSKSIYKTPPNTPRTDLSSVVIADKIYVVGGGSNVLEVFDPALDPGGKGW